MSGALFIATYALAWVWLGPDPADREVWNRLVRKRSRTSDEVCKLLAG
ncbi:MAG: hypothetical protein QM736_04720 [Vicinamibacterales bacterium]